MYRFFKSLLNVLFVLFLTLGWTWTVYLQQIKLIDDTQRYYILVAITIILTLQKIYLELPKPTNRGVVEGRHKIIEDYLRDFHAEYYKVLKRHYNNRSRTYPSVRVNVMLPTKQFRGIFGTYLKIYYFVCPEGIIYSDQELDLKWGTNNGTSGWAWKHGDISVYDSEMPAYQMPKKRLKKHQLNIVSEVKSTLSTPIWCDNKVVGVLNLDSKQAINDTMFTHEDVYTLASACAEVVSGLCFANGVEA